MKGAWQLWRVRHCASGAYLILPTQSRHKYLQGVVFSMGVPYTMFLAGFVGLIAATHNCFGRSLKRCHYGSSMCCLLMLASLWWLLIACALVVPAMLLFSSTAFCFFEWLEKMITPTAYVQQESAAKQLLLTSAHTPVGKNRSFIRTLYFA